MHPAIAESEEHVIELAACGCVSEKRRLDPSGPTAVKVMGAHQIECPCLRLLPRDLSMPNNATLLEAASIF